MHLYPMSRRGICAQMRMAIKLRRLLTTFAIAVRAFILQDAVYTMRAFHSARLRLSEQLSLREEWICKVAVGIFILVATTQIKLSRKVTMPNTLIPIRFDCNKNDSRRIFLLTSGL